MSLFSELKRRNVFRVAIAYVVTDFLGREISFEPYADRLRGTH